MSVQNFFEKGRTGKSAVGLRCARARFLRTRERFLPPVARSCRRWSTTVHERWRFTQSGSCQSMLAADVSIGRAAPPGLLWRSPTKA